MLESYRCVYIDGQGEIVEKKSRFIANVGAVNTEEEALAFIEKIKKKYYDARHNCFAFCVGEKQPILRCSDDGEPSGTAGKPILEVIKGQDLRNSVVVVTRYFGGTLLGTGGLVKAYTNAAKEGLDDSVIIEKKLAKQLVLNTNYTDIGKLQYLLATNEIHTKKTDYEEAVAIHVLVPYSQVDFLTKQCVELTSGQIQFEEGELVYYSVIDQEIILFDH